MATLLRPELRELERELHDLCQPLTSMQGRLELGKMIGGEAALLEAADGALEDSARVFAGVARLRERLLSMDAQAKPEEVAPWQ